MDFPVLDVVLVLLLIVFFVAGARMGLWVTVGSIIGFVLGAAAAFFAMPIVGSWVEDPMWRVIAVLGAALVLVLTGQGVGAAVGREITRLFRSPALRTLGALIGGAVNAAVAAVVILALSFSVSALGSPTLNQQTQESRVLDGISAVVPDPAEAWFAQLRSVVTQVDIPELAEPLVPHADSTPADHDLTPAAEVSAESVARITGVAEQCDQTQSGSGFLISSTRVVTNAHVIAGVETPTVELPSGERVTGRVVHFDADRDLALLAVDEVSGAPLDVGEPLDPGDAAFVMGYPAGGPFAAGSAEVQARGQSSLNDIYGGTAAAHEIYQLSADVRQGNSGGPVVDPDGDVVGVVFAKAMEGDDVGFALTADEAGEVLTAPGAFGETVTPGECVTR
ncbi:MAG: MarP family serine protease [Nesterenkonia sp.]|nr:MarP family serine protease [Nesterenkonia sp.]